MQLDVWDPEVIDEYHAEGWWDDRTISSIVSEHARSQPDGIAYYGQQGTSMSWSRFDAEADRLKAALIALGLDRGEGVGVMLPNYPELHAAWVGAERAGCVVVAISDRATATELHSLLNKTQSRAVVTLRSWREKPMAPLIDRIRQLGWEGCHITLDPNPQAEFPVMIDDEPAAETDGSSSSRQPLTADELFLVNFTSGTTGRPKCVMHTQNRWKYFHQKCVHLRADDTYMLALPATGGFGMWGSHFTPLLFGAPTVLMDDFSAEGMLALLEKYRVTALLAVPTQLNLLLRSAAFDTTDLSALRIVHSGGEHVAFDIAAEFERRSGAAVTQIYGSGETGCVSGPTLPEDTQERRLRWSGQINPDMNIRLFDSDGNDVTASGRGQCGVKGPGMTPGYFDDPEANAILRRPDGWILLGDIVEIDNEDYLRVVGRTSDFIIRGGLNLSAGEIEDAVRQHPRIDAVAVVAMPDEIMGERACAFVVTSDRQPLSLDELRLFLDSSDVDKHLWPERVERIDAIPTSKGKTAKGELRKMIAQMVGLETSADSPPR